MALPIIVAIGGSAGSLEALKDLFDHTLPDHASYIILRHLPTDYHSQVKAILQKHSKLRLKDVGSTIPLQENTVFIAPSGKDIILKNDKLILADKHNAHSDVCIDRFLNSVAIQGRGKNVIAIILSGGGSDGTLGAQAIKASGGMVIAQDPRSCVFKYMSQHVIDSGAADHIAIPSQIPSIIQAYVKNLNYE